MLSEAIDIISTLFDGGDSANMRGKHFDIEQAKLWDLPDEREPIGVAVSGSASSSGRHQGRPDDRDRAKSGDGEMFDEAGGSGKPRVGQIALAYGTDRDAAIQRAHEQFRWFGLGVEGQRSPAQPGEL